MGIAITRSSARSIGRVPSPGFMKRFQVSGQVKTWSVIHIVER